MDLERVQPVEFPDQEAKGVLDRVPLLLTETVGPLASGDADAAADPDDPGWPGAGLDRLVGAAAADAQQPGDDGEWEEPQPDKT